MYNFNTLKFVETCIIVPHMVNFGKCSVYTWNNVFHAGIGCRILCISIRWKWKLLSCVQLFVTPWTAAHQASLSITNSQSWLKLMSIESMMPSSVVPFSSCLQSFPASGSIQMSQFFASGGQSIGVSASVFPMNIQNWFPLGMTGLTVHYWLPQSLWLCGSHQTLVNS